MKWLWLELLGAALLSSLLACSSASPVRTDSGTYGARHEDSLDSGLDSEQETDGSQDEDVTPEEDASDEDADAASDSDCQAKSCSEQGFDCDMPNRQPDDGCGGPLICGKCKTAFDECGGGGKDFVCGCTAKTCAQLSSERGAKVCGVLADGCGKMLDCGVGCTGANTCGGAGVDSECGCAPRLDVCVGKECGTDGDGCGKTVQCGTNVGMCTATRSCDAQQKCVCKSAAEACGGRCGSIVEDGCVIECQPCQTFCASQSSCGDCQCPMAGDPGSTADDEVCRGGTCCLPDARALTCGTAQCGTKTNNCGQTVSCGSCATGLACNAGQCIDARVAAMIGTYAVRAVGFTYVSATQSSRSEAYALTEVFLRGNDLVMREQACATAAYARLSLTASELSQPAATLDPARASKTAPAETVLQIPGPSTLVGDRDWYRPELPKPMNALGFRWGRPSYCPPRVSAADQPGPDMTRPGYAPSPDPYALGARKPWLGQVVCNCPEQEVQKRGLCTNLSGSARAACVDAWAENSLPYQASSPMPDADVTDCRVIDEDQDGAPGMTLEADALIASATVRTTSVTANRFWGRVDLSGNKHHSGVSQDTPAAVSSNVACVDVALGGGLLCAAGAAGICPAYVNNERSNLIDFVFIGNLTPPIGGWTCDSVWSQRVSLFQGYPNHKDKYPAPSSCPLPQ
jgi:hypothetical protein